MPIILFVRREEDLQESTYRFLLNFVSAKEREKIQGYHFFRDAQNTLIGKILTRIAILHFSGFENEALRFIKNEYGKPSCENCPEIQFNVSHTLHDVICAIDDAPVGIDIEEKKDIDLSIAKRFFHAEEIPYVTNAKSEERMHRFYELWTKKESYIKWLGTGLSTPLSAFSVLSKNTNSSLRYHHVFEDDRVICHMCTAKKEISGFIELSPIEAVDILYGKKQLQLPSTNPLNKLRS